MAMWRASSSLMNRLRPSNLINITAPCRTFPTDVAGSSNQLFHSDINSQYGRCMPLADMHIQAKIHHTKMHPGQGGKLVQAPGTVVKILKEPTSKCLVTLPSGVDKWVDSKCRAIIGRVPGEGNMPKKLYKAGQNRWLGSSSIPTVQGVAMNPVDHSHGGGEGKSNSSGSHGKGSQTPNIVKALRPLSPHLPIYKPELTSTLSILHRISAAFLVTIVLSFYLLYLKMGLICFTYENFYQFLFYSSKIIPITVDITALALSYHLFYGVRHLLADLGGFRFLRIGRKRLI